MSKKRLRSAGTVALIVAVAGVVVMGGGPLAYASGEEGEGRYRMKMTVARQGREDRSVVPPLDRRAPARVEVATFALG